MIEDKRPEGSELNEPYQTQQVMPSVVIVIVLWICFVILFWNIV